VAVQRVAHLGAQRVARAQPARADPLGRAGGEQLVPQLAGPAGRDQQLVAVLAGVAGAADRHVAGRERHVGEVGREAGGGQHLRRPRPLHRQHGHLLVPVGHLDPFRGGRGQAGEHLGGVGRVGHQQHVVVRVQVDDQVVDDPAGGGLAVRHAAQRVLRLAGADPGQVVGERRVDQGRGPRTADGPGTQVGDVEQPHGGADGGVLGEHATAGVLDRHRPAAEVGQLGAGGHVPLVQGRSPGHAWPR
jgi:hypothetical protein